MNENLYEILGIEPTATPEEIKTAYREISKSEHPDKGGKDSRQSEINNAYTILSNPAKRQRYDETGSATDKPYENKVNDFLANIFFKLIDANPDPTSVDLIQQMNMSVQAIIRDGHQSIANNEKALKKFKRVLDKLSSKGNRALMILLERQIDQLEKNIMADKENLEFTKEILVILKDYSFDFSRQDEIPSYFLSM
jgi:curved DNA-binding protein CbpA